MTINIKKNLKFQISNNLLRKKSWFKNTCLSSIKTQKINNLSVLYCSIPIFFAATA